MSPNKEDMWGVYLEPFLPLKEEPVSTFRPCRRWKASSRSSCHISIFFFFRCSQAAYAGEGCMLRISSLPLSVSFTPPPDSTTTTRLLSSSASVLPSLRLFLARPSLLHSPPPYTLQFSFCLPQDVSKAASSSHSLHHCFYFSVKKQTLFPPDLRHCRWALTLTLGSKPKSLHWPYTFWCRHIGSLKDPEHQFPTEAEDSQFNLQCINLLCCFRAACAIARTCSLWRHRGPRYLTDANSQVSHNAPLAFFFLFLSSLSLQKKKRQKCCCSAPVYRIILLHSIK